MTQHFTRIASGIVAEIIELPDGVEPDTVFSAAMFATLVAATSDITVGQTCVDGTFGPSPAAPAATKAQLHAYADAKTATVIGTLKSYTADGVTVSVDATSATRTDIGNLATWGEANPTLTQPFVQTDYGVVIVTGAQFVALAPLVGAYALSVYATMGAVVTAISAGAITTFAQIDAASWPT